MEAAAGLMSCGHDMAKWARFCLENLAIFGEGVNPHMPLIQRTTSSRLIRPSFPYLPMDKQAWTMDLAGGCTLWKGKKFSDTQACV